MRLRNGCLIVPAGTTSLINAALQAAHSLWISSGKKQRHPVLLDADEYTHDAQIVVPSGSVLIGRGTRVAVPTVGAVDDPLNCAVLVSGSLDPLRYDSGLTATAHKNSNALAAVVGTGLSTGDYLLLSGRNEVAEDAFGFNDGANVTLYDLARVGAYAGGASIPLAWPLMKQRGRTNARVQACAAVEDVEIEGLAIDGSAGQLAVGVYCRWGVNVRLHDLTVEGTTRAHVEGVSCHDFELDGLRDLGNRNSVAIAEGLTSWRLRGLSHDDRGKRVHDLGIPRPLVFLRGRCTEGGVYDSRIGNGATVGVFHAGGHELTLSNLEISNIAISQVTYDRLCNGTEEWDNGNVVGLGLGSGFGPVPPNERGLGITYHNLKVHNLQAPSGPPWDGTGPGVSPPYRACAWYFHDVSNVTATQIQLSNKGRWHGDYRVGGVIVSDIVTSQVYGLRVEGHAYSIATNNVTEDVVFTDTTLIGTCGHAQVPYPFLFDHNVNLGGGRGPQFRGRLVISNYGTAWPAFGAAFQPDKHVTFDGAIRWNDTQDVSSARLAYYPPPIPEEIKPQAFVGGILAYDPAATGARVDLRQPEAGDDDRIVVVVSVALGGTSPGFGHLVVAPLRGNTRVRVSTAEEVLRGTPVVVSGFVVGIAEEYKAAGSGLVTVLTA